MDKKALVESRIEAGLCPICKKAITAHKSKLVNYKHRSILVCEHHYTGG